MRFSAVAASVAIVLGAVRGAAQGAAADTSSAAAARRLLDAAERELAIRSVKVNRAGWVGENFITHDTEILAADAQAEVALALKRLVDEARRFDGMALPADVRRRILMLKLQLAAPAPPDSVDAAEMARLGAGLDADYGRGRYCNPAPTSCRNLDDLEHVLADSRNPDSLLDAWRGWHSIGVPMRDRYARFVSLANAGARAMGFADAGAMWRAGYDMPPDSFVVVVDKLWQEVQPLYVQLHAYVRRRLVARYGAKLVPPGGMLPVQLLGDMWGQDWSNIADVVVPAGAAGTGVDLTAILKARKVQPLDMVRTGERFYVSLGFDSLPSTFWERSLFVRPKDRDVVCHASAWYIDDPTDLRIKMCIEPNADEFRTIHHELGHDYYFRAYKDQPFLYQAGANDGFHEAIGDAIALSITPRYLKEIGLLDSEPPATGDTLDLLRLALDHVAFLPFGITIDKWRWEVFAGKVTPDQYTKRWWELRGSYGGVMPPIPRSATDFDAGAKYHVPGNVPYMRYFLAQVLEFQFYRAMCRAAGSTGPLYRCSYYGSKEAGRRLNAMLQLGASRPWPEALATLTGQRQMDATALLDYFQPLMVWLERQNKGAPVGW
ncbi:MAG TPA: M2 family metallopeptidase [Gemmatimonadales bacterium]|nr:M2 family metallopeptidase [Gemmatimonadales bacterium]